MNGQDQIDFRISERIKIFDVSETFAPQFVRKFKRFSPRNMKANVFVLPVFLCASLVVDENSKKVSNSTSDSRDYGDWIVAFSGYREGKTIFFD